MARRSLIWALLIVALMAVGAWGLQRRLIYFPDRTAPTWSGDRSGWSDETLTTADGTQLGAWYVPPLPGEPAVAMFNGNAGNRASRLALGLRLESEGFGVLLFDYRGYGDSEGSPSESGLRLDALAAAEFIAARAPSAGVVYFGESLGAAVAAGLASVRPPGVLVLRSPFMSLADVARVHYPILPARLLLRDRYPTSQHVADIRVPTLVIAGSDDSVVPIDQSRRIFELARGPKEFVVVDGADHNDAELAGPDPLEALVRFVRDHT